MSAQITDPICRSYRVSDLRKRGFLLHPPNTVKLTFLSRSVLEIQTLLVELISTFEFSMNQQSEKVRRLPCAVMVPAVSGEESKGAQMPLKVSLVSVN